MALTWTVAINDQASKPAARVTAALKLLQDALRGTSKAIEKLNPQLKALDGLSGNAGKSAAGLGRQAKQTESQLIALGTTGTNAAVRGLQRITSAANGAKAALAGIRVSGGGGGIGGGRSGGRNAGFGRYLSGVFTSYNARNPAFSQTNGVQFGPQYIPYKAGIGPAGTSAQGGYQNQRGVAALFRLLGFGGASSGVYAGGLLGGGAGIALGVGLVAAVEGVHLFATAIEDVTKGIARFTYSIIQSADARRIENQRITGAGLDPSIVTAAIRGIRFADPDVFRQQAVALKELFPKAGTNAITAFEQKLAGLAGATGHDLPSAVQQLTSYLKGRGTTVDVEKFFGLHLPVGAGAGGVIRAINQSRGTALAGNQNATVEGAFNQVIDHLKNFPVNTAPFIRALDDLLTTLNKPDVISAFTNGIKNIFDGFKPFLKFVSDPATIGKLADAFTRLSQSLPVLVDRLVQFAGGPTVGGALRFAGANPVTATAIGPGGSLAVSKILNLILGPPGLPQAGPNQQNPASANAPSQRGIVAHASGGVQVTPTLSTLAEREPEIILPLSQTANVIRQALVSGGGRGGAPYVHLEINVTGGEGDEQAQRIADAVQTGLLTAFEQMSATATGGV